MLSSSLIFVFFEFMFLVFYVVVVLFAFFQGIYFSNHSAQTLTYLEKPRSDQAPNTGVVDDGWC